MKDVQEYRYCYAYDIVAPNGNIVRHQHCFAAFTPKEAKQKLMEFIKAVGWKLHNVVAITKQKI